MRCAQQWVGGTLGAGLNDVRLGLNGEVDLGYDEGGINLSIDAGSGTLEYVPGKIGLHAGSDNPFAGTPLAAFATGMTVDVQGAINWGNGGWGFGLTASEGYSAGGLFGSADTYTITNQAISVSTTYILNLGAATAQATATLSLGREGNGFDLHGVVDADFQVGTSAFNVHGHLDANLDLVVDPRTGRRTFRGKGSVSGGATVAGVSYDEAANFSVNDQGFSVGLKGTDQQISVKW